MLRSKVATDETSLLGGPALPGFGGTTLKSNLSRRSRVSIRRKVTSLTCGSKLQRRTLPAKAESAPGKILIQGWQTPDSTLFA